MPNDNEAVSSKRNNGVEVSTLGSLCEQIPLYYFKERYNWTTTITNWTTFYRMTIRNFVLENKVSFRNN